MMNKNNHPFHMVNYSPWPLTGSIGTLTMMSGFTLMMINQNLHLVYLGLMINMMTMYQWWRDVSREATFMGMHNSIVVKGMKISMMLFIMSEIMFFVSFFWAFLHSSLAPNMEMGMTWPPKGINTFNPMHTPLLNTTILLTSGLTITWAHHSMIFNKMESTKKSLTMTVMLGVVFTIMQGLEYMEAKFCISDSIYGACFFVSTGFHGIHVIIGTMFIMTSLIRLMMNHFSKKHHLGFETASWYWHFVDVVWMMLYIMVYWWGS